MDNYLTINLNETRPISEYHYDQREKFEAETFDREKEYDLCALLKKYALNEIVIDKSNPKVEVVSDTPKILEWTTGHNEIISGKSYIISYPYKGDIQLLKFYANPYKPIQHILVINPKNNTLNILVAETDSRMDVIRLSANDKLRDLFFNIQGINESIVYWNKRLTTLLSELKPKEEE